MSLSKRVQCVVLIATIASAAWPVPGNAPVCDPGIPWSHKVIDTPGGGNCTYTDGTSVCYTRMRPGTGCNPACGECRIGFGGQEQRCLNIAIRNTQHGLDHCSNDQGECADFWDVAKLPESEEIDCCCLKGKPCGDNNYSPCPS